MADSIAGGLSATKQDLIAALVQRELKFQSKLLPYVTDVSMYAVKGAKSISFPKFTSFSVLNRTMGAAGDAAALTSSVDKMDLDYNAYLAWIIDSSDEIQSSVDVQGEYLKRASAAHARAVDSQLLTKAKAASGHVIAAGDITKDKVLEMREFILKNDGMLDQLVLAIAVTQETKMLGITEFTSAQVYGAANIPTGMIGKVYGVNVMIHNGLAAGEAVMFSKEALAVGFQLKPQYSEQGANQYGAMAKRCALDQLLGTKALQLGEKGLASTESPLIASITA